MSREGGREGVGGERKTERERWNTHTTSPYVLCSSVGGDETADDAFAATADAAERRSLNSAPAHQTPHRNNLSQAQTRLTSTFLFSL